MIDLTYTIFGCLLLFKVGVFLLLSIPFPQKVKAKLVKLLIGNKFMKTLTWINVGLCALAILFYFDLMSSENLYNKEKEQLRIKGGGHMGSEVRINFLSYQVQKLQRNKYIAFMVVYATIALTLYLRLLDKMHNKKQDPENRQQAQPKIQERPSSITSARSSSNGDRYSINLGKETKKSSEQ